MQNFTPDYRSLSRHTLPSWYDGAKLGIFVHWGLYSLPAWAEPGDINRLIREKGHGPHFYHNPYAEWYQNTYQLDGSEAQRYHRENYGEKFTYSDFAPLFETESADTDMSGWAELFSKAGARYVVMVTKHHDGYCMWPSAVKHPLQQGYHAKRDWVGELERAVKERGMKMGLYYSGVIDWSVRNFPARDTYSLAKNYQHDQAYIDYAVKQYRELIKRYSPSVLWNDIGFPHGYNLDELFAHYYNSVPDGVINDRWTQDWIPDHPLLQPLVKMICRRIDRKTKQIEFVEGGKQKFWYDYNTPEYRSYDQIRDSKWEMVRGLGHSFAYNRRENESDMLKGHELAWILADTVSKNGNLLINVGPRADGSLPESQRKALEELGSWLELNGEAIYDTHPCPQYMEDGDENLCFTARENRVYLIIKDRSKAPGSFNFTAGSKGVILGSGRSLDLDRDLDSLRRLMNQDPDDSFPLVIRITR